MNQRPVFGRAGVNAPSEAVAASPVAEGERFMAMLALTAPVKTDFAALKQIVESEYPVANTALEQLSMPGSRPELGGFLLRLDGVMLTVLPIALPIPASELVEPLRHATQTWPDAQEALARHRAHLIVATLNPCPDHAAALKGAACVTRVTAALARLNDANAIAVYWRPGGAVTSTALFTAGATALTRQQLMPELWVRFYFIQGSPAPAGRPCTGMATFGLVAFTGYELEFEPVHLPPGEIGKRVYFLAKYLIERGPVIRDGETVGLSEREKIRVRADDSRRMPGTKIMRLTLETYGT
jgi:hypothetical protein